MIYDKKVSIHELQEKIIPQLSVLGLESMSEFLKLKNSVIFDLYEQRPYLNAVLSEAFKMQNINEISIRFYNDTPIGIVSQKSLTTTNQINTFLKKYEIDDLKTIREGEIMIYDYRKTSELFKNPVETYKIGFLIKVNILNGIVMMKHALLRMSCINKSIINNQPIKTYCKLPSLEAILKEQNVVEDTVITRILSTAKNTPINVSMLINAVRLARIFKFNEVVPLIYHKFEDLIKSIPLRFEDADLKNLNIKSLFWKENAKFNAVIDKSFTKKVRDITTFELWNDVTEGLSRTEEMDKDYSFLRRDFLTGHIYAFKILSHRYTQLDIPIPKSYIQ